MGQLTSQPVDISGKLIKPAQSLLAVGAPCTSGAQASDGIVLGARRTKQARAAEVGYNRPVQGRLGP